MNFKNALIFKKWLLPFKHNFFDFYYFSRFPVLIQGETSVGKTSLIQYLAQATGKQCVRVNNHEHTDLQEYVGFYAADETGKLVFKEGKTNIALSKWSICLSLYKLCSDHWALIQACIKVGHTPNGRSTRKDWFSSLCVMI